MSNPDRGQELKSLSPQEKAQVETIRDWMVTHLAQHLRVNPAEVDPSCSFARYGLDSAAMIGMTGDLEDWLEYELDPTLLYDYETIEDLSQYLAKKLQT